MTNVQSADGAVSRYGTVGYDLGRVGRWTRVGYGLLIAAGAAASTVVGLGEAADPGAFLLQTLANLAAITVAYLAAYWLLGERLFARSNPWLNTLILVGPALLIAYWNITLGYALGAELPAPLVLAMLAYVAASFLVQAAIGYGGCEVVALPILVFRRRYVSYCLPIVMIDAAERGWVDSSGLRRGVWVALGFASLVTVTLGMTRVGPPLLSGLAFAVVAVLVATLTYLDRRAARLRDRVAGVPAQASDLTEKEITMTEQHDRPIIERHYVASCCWPFWDRGGALFWGAALLALGGIWLAANTFGLENWGEWIVPGLFVAWGAAMLIGVGVDRRPRT